MTAIRMPTASTSTAADISYQLYITLDAEVRLTIGRLGAFGFPAGEYVYTGSARRNMAARIRRHLSSHKALRWHIDYLLAAPEAHIRDVRTFDVPECLLNQRVKGGTPAPGFGASDCRAGCGSHLKYLGV